eukprot:jgi/Bigna1/71049/fgenesh1_pg.14_\
MGRLFRRAFSDGGRRAGKLERQKDVLRSVTPTTLLSSGTTKVPALTKQECGGDEDLLASLQSAVVDSMLDIWGTAHQCTLSSMNIHSRVDLKASPPYLCIVAATLSGVRQPVGPLMNLQSSIRGLRGVFSTSNLVPVVLGRPFDFDLGDTVNNNQKEGGQNQMRNRSKATAPSFLNFNVIKVDMEHVAEADIKSAVEEVRTMAGRNGIATCIVTEGFSPANLEEELKNAGFELAASQWGLAKILQPPLNNVDNSNSSSSSSSSSSIGQLEDGEEEEQGNVEGAEEGGEVQGDDASNNTAARRQRRRPLSSSPAQMQCCASSSSKGGQERSSSMQLREQQYIIRKAIASDEEKVRRLWRTEIVPGEDVVTWMQCTENRPFYESYVAEDRDTADIVRALL